LPLLICPSFPTRRSSDLVFVEYEVGVDQRDFFGRRGHQLQECLADFALVCLDTSARVEHPSSCRKRTGVIERIQRSMQVGSVFEDRKSTRLNSSHVKISY